MHWAQCVDSSLCKTEKTSKCNSRLLTVYNIWVKIMCSVVKTVKYPFVITKFTVTFHTIPTSETRC